MSGLDQGVLTCGYDTIHRARGDQVEPGTVDLHDAAEEAREGRRASSLQQHPGTAEASLRSLEVV